MLSKEFYIIAFNSTHKAIKTEKNLKELISVELIPTPREISANCGLSLRFKENNLEFIREKLAKVDTDGMVIYYIDKMNDKKKVSIIEWS
ncbi:DUF3343 domain-containing protein [Helicovermis profundi]|uniref:DUF3343 domain-containing protein n=1 Tax=Helicovermis profundi TaxID=3065157 RepID=A0AAU9E6M3_9FIRM|nr:DUF3343 domain-containing protein [Clostridia bacterium S502]